MVNDMGYYMRHIHISPRMVCEGRYMFPGLPIGLMVGPIFPVLESSRRWRESTAPTLRVNARNKMCGDILLCMGLEWVQDELGRAMFLPATTPLPNPQTRVLEKLPPMRSVYG